jgi:RNA polymerase sigma factor (sigma-70 family)
VPANERTERLLVSVPQLGEDLLLGVFDRDGPRSNHVVTVPRNTRASRVSTPGMADSIRDEDDLLVACAEGDERALGLLYDRLGRIAYGLALRVLRDAALAEDAVQEAFLAVWRQAATFDRSRGSASTWILTLVRRRAVDLVRSQVRFNALHVQLEAMGPQGVDTERVVDDVALRETRGEVQAALATLSRAEREVLGLAYWCGLTQSEIATVLGIPRGTVKSRTFNAMARLREALSQVAEVTTVHQGRAEGYPGRRSDQFEGGQQKQWHAYVPNLDDATSLTAL